MPLHTPLREGAHQLQPCSWPFCMRLIICTQHSEECMLLMTMSHTVLLMSGPKTGGAQKKQD